jgi:hypothetical protein
MNPEIIVPAAAQFLSQFLQVLSESNKNYCALIQHVSSSASPEFIDYCKSTELAAIEMLDRQTTAVLGLLERQLEAERSAKKEAREADRELSPGREAELEIHRLQLREAQERTEQHRLSLKQEEVRLEGEQMREARYATQRAERINGYSALE